MIPARRSGSSRYSVEWPIVPLARVRALPSRASDDVRIRRSGFGVNEPTFHRR